MRAIPLVAVVLVATLAGCNKPEPASQASTAKASAPSTAASGTGEVIATFKGRTLTSDQVVQEFERLLAPPEKE
jgi:uncharacterized lipoprotein YajG